MKVIFYAVLILVSCDLEKRDNSEVVVPSISEETDTMQTLYNAFYSKDTTFVERCLDELDSADFEKFIGLSFNYRYRVFDFDREEKGRNLHEKGLTKEQKEAMRSNTMYVLRTHFKSCILFEEEVSYEISNLLNQKFVFYDRTYNENERKEIYKIINEPCTTNRK